MIILKIRLGEPKYQAIKISKSGDPAMIIIDEQCFLQVYSNSNVRKCFNIREFFRPGGEGDYVDARIIGKGFWCAKTGTSFAHRNALADLFFRSKKIEHQILM